MVTNPDGTAASLTPEEQDEVNQLTAASPVPAPAAQMIDPYKPHQYTDAEGKPVKLTPQEQSEYRKQANVIDPMLDLEPEEMADLARKEPEKFNILMAVQARPDAKEDPAAVSRIAQAWRIYRDQTGIQDLKISNIPENLWGMAKGLWSYGKDMPKVTPTAPLQSLKEIQGLMSLAETGQATPEQLERIRGLTENMYASALSLQGLARMGKNLDAKLREESMSMPGGVGKSQADRDVLKLFEDESLLQSTQELATGQRELFPGLGKVTEFLKANNTPIRPEKIQEKSAGDPLAFYLFGKVFGAASKAMPTVLSEEALAKAGQATATGVGAAAEKVGKLGAMAIPPVAKILPTVGAVKGGFVGGSLGSITGGVAAGYGAGKLAAKGLMAKLPAMETLQSIGRQIAGKEGVKSNFAQLARDVAMGTPEVAAEVGKGLAADVAMTLPAETPEEIQSVGIGAGFGLFGGGTRMGARVMRGQMIGPRAYGTKKQIPTNNVFPTLKPLNDAAFKASDEGTQTRLNAAREVVRAVFPENTETIYVPKPEAPAEVSPLADVPFLEGSVPAEGGVPGTPPVKAPALADPLIPALMAIRGPDGKPVMTPQRAQEFANSRGLVSVLLGDKRLVLIRNIEAAPHEAVGHVMEHALGESTMQQVDGLIQSDPKYQGPVWEALGQKYASGMGWNPVKQSWRDYLLSDEVSAWGRRAAAEKLLRQEVGDGPVTEAQLNETWNEYKKVNPEGNWETVLSDQEKADLSNRFVSREIFAENMDATFKHGVSPDPSLSTKLARVVGNFIRYLGGDPMAGATSEMLGVPISYDISKLQADILQKKLANAPVVVPKGGKGKPEVQMPRAGGIPRTPEEQQDAAEQARQAAEAAPDTTLAAGGTKTAREILGLVAEAIAQRSGVRINYSSAPHEPAAAITANRTVRRLIIEAFRAMPEEARALWEKSFFPERVLTLKNGGYQVLGWSPEVYAANAHRTATAIADMIANDPSKAGLSPYPIDQKTGSFTNEGWKRLYEDTQTFVRNQMGGRTGSGLPLVVPKEAAEAGAFAPSLQPGAGLDQAKADFISALFGVKTPETARITGGKMPLNVIGAEVSEATLPGRTAEPVRPRGTFEGEKAQALGIEGQPILEVNPFRNALERASQETGTPLPSWIEAIQRLNLDRIKELEHVPELPQFRGNTLTLTAGFLPSDKPNALRAAAVRDKQTGKVWTGVWHGEAFLKAMDEGFSSSRKKYDEGFTTNTPGEFLSREEAAKRATETQQLDTEAKRAEGGIGIENLSREAIEENTAWGTKTPEQPVPEIQKLVDAVISTTPEEWAATVRAPENRGASSFAHTAGARAKSPADLAILKSTYDMLADLGVAAMKAKDPYLAMQYALKKQALREAYESATGRTMDGKEDMTATIRSLHDPKYEPPLAQMMPRDEERITSPAIRLPSGRIITGRNHAEAYNKAGVSQYEPDIEAGFVTNKREFVDRAEGAAVAGRARQVADWRGATYGADEQGRPQLDTYDMVASGTELVPGQFMPSDNPRAVKTAAVRDPETGKIFEGPMHFFALEKATAAGYKPLDLIGLEQGFLTNDGEFLSRGDAFLRAKELEQIQAEPHKARELVSEDLGMTPEIAEQMIPTQFSVRKKAPPEKTVTGYKLFRMKPSQPGKIFPLFADTHKETPIGIWLDADIGKTNMAVRPGWHLGDLPVARHIGKKGPKGVIDRMAPDMVWAEVEAAADRDWQGEANKRAQKRADGTIIPRTAEIKDEIPADGYYRYQTNPNMEGSWIISGAIKVKRLLADAEVRQILREAGEEPMPREGGDLNPEKWGLDPKTQFAAPKKEWKMLPGGGGFSKAWILPNGKPVQLGPQWHHSWLDENPAIRKKYGLRQSASAEDNRTDALKKGFARINYSVNDGKLTVEARAKNWPDLRDSVKEFVRANLGSVDSMEVNLFDNNVKKVVDEGFEQLFKLSKEEKMNHLPLITAPSEVVEMSAQASAAAWDRLWDATQWAPKIEEFNKDEHIASALAKPGWAVLSGTQEALGAATAPENVKNNAALEKVLTDEGLDFQKITGTYKGVPQGESFLVTGITPERALELGRQFKQESVLVPEGLLYSDNTINPALPEKTLTGPAAIKEDFYSTTPGGASFSMGLDFEKRVPFEPVAAQPDLLASEVDRTVPLSAAQVAQMTKAQLTERYPEAVIPKARYDAVPSNIVGSPLYKQAKTEARAVQEFAKKLLEFAEKYKDHPAYQSGLKWYSGFVPRVKKVFGADAPVFVELLAGTSPNERPANNFKMAVEALQNFKSGMYDAKIKKFEEALNMIKDGTWESWLKEEIASGGLKKVPAKPSEETFVNHWYQKYDLAPRKANGALFGISSKAVLKVLARQWLQNTPGLKTQNFVQNLLGTGHEATIDVWADRTMRRIGYEGFRPRWRVLPLNATGITDPDFRFGQKVFRSAAEQLGILPDALQGALWFAEKQYWADNGWAKLDLGDFREEIAKYEKQKATPEPETTEPELALDVVEPRPLKQ